MNKFEELEMMHEAIYMVMDEHGILLEDGHWMTDEECAALSEKEIVDLFNLCYDRNETWED